MTEDEWYDRGDEEFQRWNDHNNGTITQNERDAFELAWELAGREMGIVE